MTTSRRTVRARLLLVLITLLLLGAPAPAQAAAPLPTCRYTDLWAKFRAYPDWNRTLLDTIYRISSGYAPQTQPVSRAGLGGGGGVRYFVLPDLRAMKTAANRAGIPLYSRSAYRSYGTQQSVFAYWVDQVGYQAALKVSARPGHSEHQLGTTLDLTHALGAAPWDWTDWATTRTGSWLRWNAWRYGFVMSYPKGKERYTCYSYEPWHYRYVGVPRAKAVHDSGLTLRQWLWYRGGNG